MIRLENTAEKVGHLSKYRYPPRYPGMSGQARSVVPMLLMLYPEFALNF